MRETREADPRHGELWTAQAKRVENWRKKADEIAKIVAGDIRLFEEV